MIKKKIFYWSPCLNPVGTVISTINSALAISKFSEKHEVTIINACGEWDNYLNEFKQSSVKIVDLTFKYFKYLPKTGFLPSRLSYLLIYIFSFVPLLMLIKKKQPDFIIAHLITSLPLSLMSIFNLNAKFILRISGYPKMNFIRKIFWKKISKKLDIITCPTEALITELTEKNIFNQNRIFYLPDAILSYKRLIKKKNLPYPHNNLNKKIILAVGRLTKQKNFDYLIKEFHKFNSKNKDYNMLIIGDGEDKRKLKSLINKLNLVNRVFLLDYTKNVFNFMKNSDVFILSSLWEEVGFVIIEAAINNLFIISSDCPNGPTEFLNGGVNGLLFKNNQDGELFKSLLVYSKLDKNKKFKDRVILKKKTLHYSKFRHYLALDKILTSLTN